MRDTGGVTGHSGAVTVVQRTSADLRLTPHFHAVLLDSVFATGPDDEAAARPAEGASPFYVLPDLQTADVADLLQVIRVRVLGLLNRRGVVESNDALTVLDDGFAEREPALAALAAAAVHGLP